MTLTLLVVASPLVCYGLARLKKDDSFLTLANRAVFLSILLQVMTLVMFLVRARDGRYPSLDADGLFPTSLAASPFILSGLVGGVFISLLYLLLLWRRPDLERLLPSADNLDRITYKTICLAFPLLTLMIASGAYWANQTWGSYWSWDPKETWAAITWLVYAALSAHAHHPRMAWPSRRLLCHRRLCRGDVHFLRRDVPAARIARLCVIGTSRYGSYQGIALAMLDFPEQSGAALPRMRRRRITLSSVRVNWQIKAILPVVLVLLAGLLLFILATVSFRDPERHAVLIVAGAGAVVICGVSIGALAYFIQRPMVELQEKIALVSEGNLNVAVSFSKRNDEIGDLGRNFNHMMQQLRESREEIETPASHPNVPRRAPGDPRRVGRRPGPRDSQPARRNRRRHRNHRPRLAFDQPGARGSERCSPRSRADQPHLDRPSGNGPASPAARFV